MSEMNHMKLKQHGSAVMMYDEYPANAAWLKPQILGTETRFLLYGECCRLWDMHMTRSLLAH